MTAIKQNGDSGNSLAAALIMANALLEIGSVKELLREGLSLCLQVLKCERGFLIAQSSQGKPEVLKFSGSGDKTIPYSTTALRLVKQNRVPILISDTVSDEVFSARESIHRSDIRSVLCSWLDFPLTTFADSDVFLYLDSSIAGHPFDEKDLEIFKLLSALMASLVKKSEILAQKETVIEALKSQMKEKQFEDLVFQSPSFENCIKVIKQAAPTDVPVLLIGETGTGKERLARAIHKQSSRRENPFIAVNCGAIPENLIESELFGHEKGAFTGAIATRKGHFEEASNGTLFLDEIGDLPQQMQVKLLRVLQENEIQRVGSSKPLKVNVRIVAATNKDLAKEVEQNLFRKDLFFRLSVVQITIPPVRDRSEDSLLLSRYFLRQYCEMYSKKFEFSKAAEKAILMFSWPGNVREIQNRVQRAVITAAGNSITPETLNLNLDSNNSYTSLYEAREAVDKEMIAQALKKAPGNLTSAAKILGIDRKSLRLLIEKYGIKTNMENEA